MSKGHREILNYIKSAKPRGTAHKILSQDDYLGGIVAKVEYKDNDQTIVQWVVVTSRHNGYADSESQLIQQLQNASHKEAIRIDWIDRIFNLSGLIALFLVGASVYLTIKSPDGNIPEHIKASFLTIVGFYFGGLIRGKKSRVEA